MKNRFILKLIVKNNKPCEFDRINIIGSFVQLTLLYNRGGLFGIFQGYQNFFLILSIIVLCLIVLFYIYEKKKSYSLILVGCWMFNVQKHLDSPFFKNHYSGSSHLSMQKKQSQRLLQRQSHEISIPEPG